MNDELGGWMRRGRDGSFSAIGANAVPLADGMRAGPARCFGAIKRWLASPEVLSAPDLPEIERAEFCMGILVVTKTDA